MAIGLDLLAQAAPGQGKNASAAFVWAVILIVVVMVGGIVVMWMRRKLFAADTNSAANEGLMDSLRRMRDTGQMSPEEFDAAKKAMVSRISGQPARVMPKPAPVQQAPKPAPVQPAIRPPPKPGQTPGPKSR